MFSFMGQQEASPVEKHREGAEVYSGDHQLCKAKYLDMLQELHLPLGLLPLDDVDEVGFNRGSGFVWLRQKKKKDHLFKGIGRLVSYANEVTAFVQDRRMTRMTGVKSKELLLWITISDMFIDDPASAKITFRTPAGLSRSFPVSAFQLTNNDAAASSAAVNTNGDN